MHCLQNIHILQRKFYCQLKETTILQLNPKLRVVVFCPMGEAVLTFQRNVMASKHQELPPNDSDMCQMIRETTLNLAQTPICFHYYFSDSAFMQSYIFNQKITEQLTDKSHT